MTIELDRAIHQTEILCKVSVQIVRMCDFLITFLQDFISRVPQKSQKIVVDEQELPVESRLCHADSRLIEDSAKAFLAPAQLLFDLF